MEQIRLLVCGVTGAMGKAVVSGAEMTAGVTVVAGFDQTASVCEPFPIYNRLDLITEPIDAVIDFSHRSVAKAIAEFCYEKKIPLVSATTGIDEEAEAYYRNISASIPVFRSKNFSYGISVLKKLVGEAAKLLADDFDIEVIEAHHNKKADAPSGTAQMLLDSIADGAERDFEILHGRYGNQSGREKNQITVHAVRGGTIVGEHSVLFAGEDEIITISHSALSKKVFASGALKAMKFIMKKQNGFYSMDDITAIES